MTLTDLYNKNYLDTLNKTVEDILDDILYEYTDTVELSLIDPKLDTFALHVPQHILPVPGSSLLNRYLAINCGPEQPFRIVLLHFYYGIGHYDGHEVIYQQPKQDMMNKKERLEYVKEQFFKLFKNKYRDILLHL